MSASKKKQPTLTEYLAGTGIANLPIFILALLSSYIEVDISPLQRSSIILTLIVIGTTLAGFLVARRVSESCARAGAATGAISFLIYCAFIFSVFRSTAWNIWIFFVFVLGGYTGGKLWEIVKELPVDRNKLRKVNAKPLDDAKGTEKPDEG